MDQQEPHICLNKKAKPNFPKTSIAEKRHIYAACRSHEGFDLYNEPWNLRSRDLCVCVGDIFFFLGKMSSAFGGACGEVISCSNSLLVCTVKCDSFFNQCLTWKLRLFHIEYLGQAFSEYIYIYTYIFLFYEVYVWPVIVILRNEAIKG